MEVPRCFGVIVEELQEITEAGGQLWQILCGGVSNPSIDLSLALDSQTPSNSTNGIAQQDVTPYWTQRPSPADENLNNQT